uniref:C2 domain-containing protein n=1 Tax=Trypanosoma congolense (strain IL3000) TaxID=1068625 RepID=G0UQ04_TRYCI|nr:conserved hypothetical protein [Trypanosoma congolense IL3000]
MPVHYACVCCSEINPARGRNHLLRTVKQEKDLAKQKLFQLNIFEERAKNVYTSVPRPRTSNFQRGLDDEELNQPAVPLPPLTLDELRKMRHHTNTTRLIVTVHRGKSINVDPRDPVSVLVRCGAFEGQTAKVPRGKSAICTWEELFEFPYPNEEEGLEVLVVDDALPAEDHIFGGIAVPPHALRNRARGDEETLPVCAVSEMHRSYGRMKETPMGSIVVSWYVKREGEEGADGADVKQNLEGGPINCNFVVHRLFQYTDNGAIPYNGGVLCLIRDTDDNCSESALYVLNGEGALSSSPYYGKDGCNYLPDDRTQMLQLITPKKLGHVLICVSKDEVMNEEDEELIVVGAVPLDFEKLYQRGSAVLLVESKIKEDVLWGEIALEWGIIPYSTIQRSNEEERQGAQISNDRAARRSASGPRESLFLTVVRGLNLTDREGEPLAQGQVSVFACDMEGSTYAAPAVVEGEDEAHVITWNQEVRFIEMDGGQSVIDVQVLDGNKAVSSGRFELTEESASLTVQMHDPQDETQYRGEILVSYRLIRSTEEEDGAESQKEALDEAQTSSPGGSTSVASEDREKSPVGELSEKEQCEILSDNLTSARDQPEGGSQGLDEVCEHSPEVNKPLQRKTSARRSRKNTPRKGRSKGKSSSGRRSERSQKDVSPREGTEDIADDFTELNDKSIEEEHSRRDDLSAVSNNDQEGVDEPEELHERAVEDKRTVKHGTTAEDGQSECEEKREREITAEDVREAGDELEAEDEDEQEARDELEAEDEQEARDELEAEDEQEAGDELEAEDVQEAEDELGTEDNKAAEDGQEAENDEFLGRSDEDEEIQEDADESHEPQENVAEGGKSSKGSKRSPTKKGKQKSSVKKPTKKSPKEKESVKEDKTVRSTKDVKKPTSKSATDKSGKESKPKRTATDSKKSAGKSPREDERAKESLSPKQNEEEGSVEADTEPCEVVEESGQHVYDEELSPASQHVEHQEDAHDVDEPDEENERWANEESEDQRSPDDSVKQAADEGVAERRKVKVEVPLPKAPQKKPPIGKSTKQRADKAPKRQGNEGRESKATAARDRSGDNRGPSSSAHASKEDGAAVRSTERARKDFPPEARSGDQSGNEGGRRKSPRTSIHQPHDNVDDYQISVTPGTSIASASWEPWHPTKNAKNEDHIPLEKRATFRNRTETIKQLEMRSRESRGSSGHPSNRGSSRRESSAGRGSERGRS